MRQSPFGPSRKIAIRWPGTSDTACCCESSKRPGRREASRLSPSRRALRRCRPTSGSPGAPRRYAVGFHFVGLRPQVAKHGFFREEGRNGPGNEHRRHHARQGMVADIPLEHVERLHDRVLNLRAGEVHEIRKKKDPNQRGQDCQLLLVHPEVPFPLPARHAGLLGKIDKYEPKSKGHATKQGPSMRATPVDSSRYTPWCNRTIRGTRPGPVRTSVRSVSTNRPS